MKGKKLKQLTIKLLHKIGNLTIKLITQHYFIFLNHTTDQINKDNNYGRSDLVKTVTETIHYQDENGDSITKDYVNQATFLRPVELIKQLVS